jgi:ParB family chromosome partitioning protein
MNAVTADEVIYVPLSKLRVSEKNVRKKGELGIEQLAAQIHAEGLLQNLVVVANKGGVYDIVDGKRRFLALQHLSKGMLLDLDREVAVKIVDASHATSASLSAAFSQLPLHPVDQFDAFQALVDEGKSAAEVAAAFGIQERAVLQSLRLAGVARPIIEAYRNDEIGMSVLQAFTLTDDPRRQLQAFKSLPKYGDDDDHVRHVRDHLTQKEVSLGTSRLAKLVGVDAYEAAGGATRRDMFSTDVFFSDTALVQRIADAKVADLTERVRAEGWAWVDVRLENARLYEYQARKPKISPTTPEQDKELKSIKNRQEQLGKELAEHRKSEPTDGDESSPAYLEWAQVVGWREREHAQLGARDSQIRAECETWSSRTLSEGGALITLTHDGELVVHRGLIDEKTSKRLAKAKAAKPAAGSAADANMTELPEISDSLHQRLAAYRSSVIRRQLQLNTGAMLAVLAHSLVRGTFGHHNWGNGVTTISCSPTDSNHAMAGVDMDQFTPHLNLSLDRSASSKTLPDASVPALQELLSWSDAHLLELIASCVATSFSGIYGKGFGGERADLIDLLVEFLDIDMRDHWQADQDRYLGHVPKPLIIQAVTEAKGAVAAKPLATMKKTEAAEAAEIHLEDAEWLPALYRRKSSPAGISQEEAVAHIQQLLETKRQRDGKPSSWPANPEAAPITDKARPKLKAPPITKVTGKNATVKKTAVKKVAAKKVAKA